MPTMSALGQKQTFAAQKGGACLMVYPTILSGFRNVSGFGNAA